MPPSNLLPVRIRALRIRSSPFTPAAYFSSTHTRCRELQSQPSAPVPSIVTDDGAKERAVRPQTKRRSKDSFSRTWRPSQLDLQYLTDPVKLALSTRKLIQKGQREEALELVRAASKDRPCTVSWNHIINDSMQEGKVQSAFHFFNEMRKRGQKPDGHTYTILFRGLTENVSKTPSAVERALTLLNAMQFPTAPVAPTSIHINAALEVCAKARDLDSIYAIVAKLPERGPGSPDHRTYTMILNCLTTIASQKPDLTTYREADIARMRQQSILQGKRLWADVLERWKRGKLTMDEGLMDAMGRLLLLGDVRNHDEILSLVSQAAQVPRKIPMIGDPKRQTHLLTQEPVYRAKLSASSESSPASATSDPPERPEAQLSLQEAPSGEGLEPDLESQKLFAMDASKQRLHTYAVPRNRTLSLLMIACGRMHAFAASQKYWGLITSKTEPDLDNFHEYLRVLRVQRASRLGVELLRQVCTPKEQGGFGLTPTPATFRLAMSTCVRDLHNPNCLQHAREVLALQREHIKVPNVRTGQFLVTMMNRCMGQWPVEEMMATMDSLDVMWMDLKSFTAYGDGELTRNNPMGREISTDTRREMAMLTQDYYRLLENAMAHYRERIGTATFTTWNERLHRNRNKINRWKKIQKQEWWFRERPDEAPTASLEAGTGSMSTAGNASIAAPN